ncbi:MAG: radical SAM protein [Deltaproteobacteria bacterium]|nr:radical SAM protein [Deltaproteobacteria bacterium]
MILLIEPISKNIGMYVPAYPLPIMEIASFVKFNIPELEISIISIPMDYGLPFTQEGKRQIYKEVLKDLSEIKPSGIGISCTAIAQAEEVIHLCELIKDFDPNIFIFLGGYFPTIYYEEILFRTSAVDLIVIGEGEVSALKIIELLERGKDPVKEDIPNLAWKKDGQIYLTKKGERFDLKKKALLNLKLLRYPRAYDILPYAFSRGCPYHCNFCMEEFIRPLRKAVPPEIIFSDLTNLSNQSNTHTLMISDALFKSFDLFPFLRSLGMKINFETRCDVLDPFIIHKIADICGMLVLGFESASYNTLRRMNKVRDRAHYQKYISNTIAIFKEAVRNEIPIMVFMIAGYPGDTEEDLEESLLFVRELSKNSGSGGHVFKIGECHVYPKTNIHNLTLSLPDVVFDNDGVFGQNIVRQPSKDLNFETVLAYMREIFNLSNSTPKLQTTFLNMMPFFRLPSQALRDNMIPDICYRDNDKRILNVQGKSLFAFRELVPMLIDKYKKFMSGQRSTRNLPL